MRLISLFFTAIFTIIVNVQAFAEVSDFIGVILPADGVKNGGGCGFPLLTEAPVITVHPSGAFSACWMTFSSEYESSALEVWVGGESRVTLHGYPMSDAEGRLVMACATSAPETLDHSPNMISKVVVKHTQSCDWVWEGSDVPALLPWSVVQESTQYAVVYEMTYLLEIASEMVAQQPVAGSCYLSETGAVVCDGVDSSSDTMVMRVIAAGTVLLTATAIFAVIHLKGVVASRGGSKSLTRPSAFHAPVAVRVADRNSSTANDHSVSLASNSMTAPPPMPTFQPVWSQLCVDRIAVVCEEDSNNFAWSSVPGGVVTSRRVVTKAQQKRVVDDSNPTSVALSKLLTVVENEEDSEDSQSVESAELQAVAEAMAWDQPLSDTEEDY